MAKNILILDTQDEHLKTLGTTFRKVTKGSCNVHRVFSSADLVKKIRAEIQWDLIALDFDRGDMLIPGSDILRSIRHETNTPIIAIADKGDVASAEKAISLGANDFLVRTGKLSQRVTTLLNKVRPHLSLLDQNRQLHEQNQLLLEERRAKNRILGNSPQILTVIQKIQKIAHIPRPILILGERGTGKELIAQAIHETKNPSQPLIVINCAAFPDSLLETELFGHEKGAFSGAHSQIRGKFELAHGGTLFLDEIGNMSLPFQQKILRVVEYGTFLRVGGRQVIHVNTRIIAATNVNLQDRINQGSFLPDLYDRLSFEEITAPPLRKRKEDIKLLADSFLKQFVLEVPSLQTKILADNAVTALQNYSFPGNVRELKHIIERAAYRSESEIICVHDLELLSKTPEPSGTTFYDQVESFKAKLIMDCLKDSNNNQAEASRRLGLSYHQFRYFLKKYTQ